MHLGLICGSPGPASSNQAVLDVVASRARDRGATTTQIGGLAEIPAFDPVQVDEPPEPVARFRAALDGVDAVVIAAPEYAAGVAGAVKNGLDWLVGAGTLYHRPAAVMSAGTTGGPFAIEQLVRTLSWQGALVLATLGVAAPRTKMTASQITDPATIDEIRQASDTLIDAIRGEPSDRLAALRAVVSGYGIDPARFGDIA